MACQWDLLTGMHQRARALMCFTLLIYHIPPVIHLYTNIPILYKHNFNTNTIIPSKSVSVAYVRTITPYELECERQKRGFVSRYDLSWAVSGFHLEMECLPDGRRQFGCRLSDFPDQEEELIGSSYICPCESGINLHVAWQTRGMSTYPNPLAFPHLFSLYPLPYLTYLQNCNHRPGR